MISPLVWLWLLAAKALACRPSTVSALPPSAGRLAGKSVISPLVWLWLPAAFPWSACPTALASAPTPGRVRVASVSASGPRGPMRHTPVPVNTWVLSRIIVARAR